MNRPFVAIDVETTGLKPWSGDRVVELGGVMFDLDGSETKHFQEFINPGRQIPQEATDINGITNEMVRTAKPASIVMLQFMAWCEENFKDIIFIAHNASFDLGFLTMEFGRFCPQPDLSVVCTLDMARTVHRGLRNHKLPTILEHYGISTEGSHRALADAKGCKEIFVRMLPEIGTRQFKQYYTKTSVEYRSNNLDGVQLQRS